MRVLVLVVRPLIAQKAPFTPARKILQIHREFIKPGKASFVAQLEQDSVRNRAELNSPLPRLALSSTSGPSDLWLLNGYDTYADIEQVAAAMAAIPDLLGKLKTIGYRKADNVYGPRTIFARLREDLSYGRGLTGSHTRYILTNCAGYAFTGLSTIFHFFSSKYSTLP